mgnify:CR=1 FL=1
MLRFFSIDQGVITETEPAADTPLVTSIKNAHWIDTINPTEEERQALASTLNITLPGADDVEETVAYNTLGTVVHEALDEMYIPFINKFLNVDDILKMEEIAKDLITKHFKIHFKNGDISTGKNRLIFEVANRFVTNFLAKEKELLKDENNQLKIINSDKFNKLLSSKT